jgi:hypothetical protein
VKVVVIVESWLSGPLGLSPSKLEREFVTRECALRGCIIADPHNGDTDHSKICRFKE